MSSLDYSQNNIHFSSIKLKINTNTSSHRQYKQQMIINCSNPSKIDNNLPKDFTHKSMSYLI